MWPDSVQLVMYYYELKFHRKSVSMTKHSETESDVVKNLYSIPYTINMNDNEKILSAL